MSFSFYTDYSTEKNSATKYDICFFFFFVSFLLTLKKETNYEFFFLLTSLSLSLSRSHFKTLMYIFTLLKVVHKIYRVILKSKKNPEKEI